MKALLICGLFALICACTPPPVPAGVAATGFAEVNGVLYHDAALYSGVYQLFHPNGQMKSRTAYQHGRKHGSDETWYTSGAKQTERSYRNGVKTGVHQGWWENGQPKFLHPFDEKGAYHGVVKEWYESGQLYQELTFQHGDEDGTQKAWKTDGRIKANYVVKNGERFGLIGLKRCVTVVNETGTVEHK